MSTRILYFVAVFLHKFYKRSLRNFTWDNYNEECNQEITGERRKVMKKIVSLLMTSVLCVGVFTGCGVKEKNQEANVGVQTSDLSVSTDGSTSMEKVIGSLGEIFYEETGITVTYNPTGSGSGIKAVSEGRCDIGLSSRN